MSYKDERRHDPVDLTKPSLKFDIHTTPTELMNIVFMFGEKWGRGTSFNLLPKLDPNGRFFGTWIPLERALYLLINNSVDLKIALRNSFDLMMGDTVTPDIISSLRAAVILSLIHI